MGHLQYNLPKMQWLFLTKNWGFAFHKMYAKQHLTSCSLHRKLSDVFLNVDKKYFNDNV